MSFLFRQPLLLAVFCWILALDARAQMPFYGDYFLHDPGTLIKDGTNYYIFGDGQGIPGKTTSDLRNWTAAGTVFPSASPPAWTTNNISGFAGYFWAPDIAYFNGRYNLYYACSVWGGINSAIGLVTSPSLNSSVWTDQGKVIESNDPTTTNTDLTANNCIDPSVLVDTNGTVWLSFGSYSDGILVMQIDPATGKRISPSSTITKIASSTTTFFANTTEASCLYQRGGWYYLFLNYGGCCAGVSSTYNIRVGRSTSVTGPYLDRSGGSLLNGGGTMVLESTARYIGPGHAAIMNDNGTNWFTYHYYDGKNNGNATVGMSRLYWTDDGWPALTNDWSAFYSFRTNAAEHLGLYNGALQNNAAVTNDAARGGVLNLDGATNFVSLPLSMGNASTFATWVKWNGGADWQRIFDFGASTTNYFFLTPRASSGRMRFAITTNGAADEQQINAATALPTNSWCHVAVTLDGARGVIYLDGTPVGTNSSLTRRPWQTLAVSNYLGKSQFAADPLFSGELSSFRIFGRALSASEIRDLAFAHPALAHRYSFGTNANSIVWDSIGMAHGALMGSAVITNNALKLTGATGGYANLPGGLVSGSAAVTLEFWAAFGATGNWARVVDFGNISGGSGQNYFFFSPHNGSSGQTMEMRINSSTTTFAFTPVLDNRTVHVVCIVDSANNNAAVYTNGVLETTRTGSWPAFTNVSSAWSFIGRSLFSGDAYLNATIDELRIYDGRLTTNEIAADFQAGPNALAQQVSLTQSNSVSGVNLSWPSYAGFVLETASALNGPWTNTATLPALNNDRWQAAVSTTNAAQFFRLRR
jgi:Glycosyl hydrolases family 43/Concanavalin A-like lectin/glucanases superfamily